MRITDILELKLLAALWGASFLFTRIAAPEFGPVVLVQLRVTVAALFLLPILLSRDGGPGLRQHWKKLALLGILNSAIPFYLLSYSTLSLTGGFASILNATAPLFTAVVAWLWLSEALDGRKITGLFIGFVGVLVLVWDKLSFQIDNTMLAIGAGIAASVFYGIGANFTRKYANNIGSLMIATGSMIGAAIFLLPGTALLWPAAPVSARAWVAVVIMGIASTAVPTFSTFA